MVRIVIVQHGDKVRDPGDPGLTDLGQRQATSAAERLVANEAPVALRTSPLRRAVETGAPIADAFGLEPTTDERLRERMNWDGTQPFEAFLADWQRATADRSFVPTVGDSSFAAADRFLAALEDVSSSIPDGATAIVVAHGGVTVDTLRTILGDDALTLAAPTLIDDGVPSAAITVLRRAPAGWSVEACHRRAPRHRPTSQPTVPTLDRPATRPARPTPTDDHATPDGGQRIMEV